MRKQRVPGSRQVDDESSFLLKLRTQRGARRGRELRLVIVAIYGRSRSTVQQGVGALGQDRRGVVRIDARSSARKQDFFDVALSKRPLARGDLDDRRPMLGAFRRRDGRDNAQGREHGERQKNRDNWTPPTGGEWPEVRPPRHLSRPPVWRAFRP